MIIYSKLGKLYKTLVIYNVIIIIEGRTVMNKNKLEETKKVNYRENIIEEVSDASNSDVTRMYNMPGMASGPSDATPEEKRHLSERSAANNNNTEK